VISKTQSPKAFEKIFIALDNMTKEEVFIFLDQAPEIKKIKIGMELFYAYGPMFLDEIKKKYHHEIFLDLKLHDIPQTVSRAIKSLSSLPINSLTIHLSGGEAMLSAAYQAKETWAPHLQLIGVSVLTSLDSNDYFNIHQSPLNLETYKHLFNMASNAKLNGVVCSPLECSLKSNYELNFICPGIRFESELNQNEVQDQKRVASFESQINHADFLVIGRSITNLIQTPTQLRARLDYINHYPII